MKLSILIFFSLIITSCYSKKHPTCNSRQVHIPYTSKNGNYILSSDMYVPMKKYNLSLSAVPNDSSLLPLLQFVKKSTSNNTLKPLTIVFYTTDSNVISFLNNDCTSSKAFIIYEKEGNKYKSTSFIADQNNIFTEDTSNTIIEPLITFNHIDQVLLYVRKTHPEVTAYHLFSINYVVNKQK